MDDFADADPAQAQLDLPEGLSMSRAEKRDQQTQRIMDAAKNCFVRHGFQGASMQQICTECGMSPGALYRYFPSKESIIEAITEADRREDSEIFSAMFDNPSVVDGVVEAAMAHIRHVHDRNIAPLFAEIRAESMRNPAIRLTCHENMSAVSGRLGLYIGSAIERGEIDPPGDLPTVLAMFMAIGEGLAINDLPTLGFAPDKLEPLVRGTIEGMLRPRKPPPQGS
jgi:TetR/AcrR family transcriptional repressor of uid operon